MSNSTYKDVDPYFEESWAILSTIGMMNFFIGFMIVGITSFSQLVLVPIIVSGAACIANGLCYYAFYADYPLTGTVVAAVCADLAWLIQEAGLSFYSYIILIRVLNKQSLRIFLGIFWTLMLILVVVRTLIAVNRAQDLLYPSVPPLHQSIISTLHIIYFSTIAVAECTSAFFLLRRFASAKKVSIQASSTGGLFKHLMRSTETRLVILAAIGASRAVTYSFQTTAQSAVGVAGQVDRFVYTLECLFPIMMFIDILASRLVVSNHSQDSSSHNRSRGFRGGSRIRKDKPADDTVGLYSMNGVETRVDAKHQLSSSQERIVDRTISRTGTREDEDGLGHGKKGGINKTVEFEFHESAV